MNCLHSFATAPISGPCHFYNGDRVPLYWIWDFTNEEGYPRIAAICNTYKKTDVSNTIFTLNMEALISLPYLP